MAQQPTGGSNPSNTSGNHPLELGPVTQHPAGVTSQQFSLENSQLFLAGTTTLLPNVKPAILNVQNSTTQTVILNPSPPGANQAPPN